MPDEQTSPRPSTFTEEDREALQARANWFDDRHARSIEAALAYIEELEARVRLADELAEAASRLGPPLSGIHPTLLAIIQTAAAYEAATTEVPDE